MIPARLRNGAAWADACILNISSRGLLVHSPRGVPQGGIVELRRGEHVIVARVVWRDGTRVGLRADDRLPVDEIISLDGAAAFQLTAPGPGQPERRKRQRPAPMDSRLRGRAMEFVSVGVIAASLFATAAGLLAWTAGEGRTMRDVDLEVDRPTGLLRRIVNFLRERV